MSAPVRQASSAAIVTSAVALAIATLAIMAALASTTATVPNLPAYAPRELLGGLASKTTQMNVFMTHARMVDVSTV